MPAIEARAPSRVPSAGMAGPPSSAVSSFLGRRQELSQLAGLLERSRLITIAGPPGIGKTRLALELVDGLSDAYPDGTRLVELALIGDPARVPRAVASGLSLQEVTGAGLDEVLVAHLRDRRLLLVLDNCEHVVGACAQLVETLLEACSKLRIVATSREPLGSPGERIWQLAPLSAPDTAEMTPEALESYDAVRLFVERAAAVQPGFVLNAYVGPTTAEICRRLDGIPLAIELAAARMEGLTPVEIARRLDDRFNLLVKNSRNHIGRHDTLQGALDWSHDLLSAPERALLRRLSVFVGGFDLEAAEVVCTGGEVDAVEASHLLDQLVAKSLVVTETNSSSPDRYRLLETIRAYGADRLEEAGETASLRKAHARFYLALAEQAESELTGPRQERWFDLLDDQRANLRGALEWSLGHSQTEWALRLAGALVLFWRVRCHFSEGRELLDAVILASDGANAALQAKALWGAGFLALMAGDHAGAGPVLEESLARYRKVGDRSGCARALLILGNCKHYSDPASVLPLLARSAALARKVGDPWCLAHALGVAGHHHASRDQLSAARLLLEECLQVARKAQDKQGLRMGLLGLGSVAVRQGDYRSAHVLLEEAVELARGLGEDYARATALQHLGELAFGQGKYGQARQLLDEALALIPVVGPPAAVLGPLLLLGRVARSEGDRRGARELFEKVLTDARADVGPYVVALQAIGELAAEEGDMREGRRLLEEARDQARASCDRSSMAEALRGLGELTRVEGDAKRAGALHSEALQIQEEIGGIPRIAASLEAMAGLSAESGSYDHAARLFGAAAGTREANGYARTPWESARYQADLALARENLGAAEFEAAFAEGVKLSLREAVTEASGGRERRGRPTSGWSSLTESEHQVADLVGAGLTNPEIAERLFISLSTVKAHLSHIYSKLGVGGRTALAQEVWRRGR